jgi:uncharacterized protein
MKHTILLAGGTGLIGSQLSKLLISNGHEVRILTRRPINKRHIGWDPSSGKIEVEQLKDITVIINLLGENIGEKRWTRERKLALSNSRVQTTQLLFAHLEHFLSLQHYIGASGLNCYEKNDNVHGEDDPFGSYFLADLVKEWEQAHQLFSSKVPVCLLRISTVLTAKGGALDKMKVPVKFGIGSPLGNGKQYLPWIHVNDLCRLFFFAIDRSLEGIYNSVAGFETNKDFLKTLAKVNNKPFFFPAVPAFMLKILLGEMSALVLDSMKASNAKLMKAGFKFDFTELEPALKSLK